MKKITAIFALLALAGMANAQVGGAYDTRGMVAYSLAKDVYIFGFEYSGSLQLYANDSQDANDFGSYFMRQNLAKWIPYDAKVSLGVAAEYDDMAGYANDFLRLAPAVQYAVGKNKAQMAYYFYESDGGGQKWAFNLSLALGRDVKLDGFADYFIGDKKLFMAEPVLQIRLIDDVWITAAFSLNELFDNEQRALGLTEKSGFQFGLSVQ